jgi:membrane-associated phospholipid phosphatase
LKHQVFPERKRPSAALEAGSIREVPTVPLHRNNSFPSGHTATAFTGFCSLALFSRKAAAQAFFAIVAAMVGYSRMYLGQHFMTDVLAGAVIGTAVALVTDRIFAVWQPKWLHPNQA